MRRRTAITAALGVGTAGALSAVAAGAPGLLQRHPPRASAALAQAHPVAARSPFAAPRPRVVTRAEWGADERLRDPSAHYAPAVTAMVLHHTNSGNGYRADEVPEMIRSLYVDHVRRRGWGDLGYNFMVDRFGTIYEGRAGGITRAVIGAHADGFNVGTAGVAAIGSYGPSCRVPAAMGRAIAALAAWKLGLEGVDPRGTTRITSTDDHSRYPSGRTVDLPAILGHRDTYETYCPGRNLYDAMPRIRAEAARLQGRH
ncbi:hypothetical protein BIV57_19260 [Mangrovactinospora gilvigrisea]|uniref:Peptidoglycan recognition protein family domain-containing protein n=1 Tax=Mangrovactinospora gilvigrisea TaxID=1428644 RepID=A0A1J7BB31_9ACTN|nr:N-acetylmuramoyl-L-alanine amidase [Mangrovactinospora gilvigrisea]OIV35859.1 hypothetical protein BIV57_19260 [Mangrovactinospora gilvigrisea]